MHGRIIAGAHVRVHAYKERFDAYRRDCPSVVSGGGDKAARTKAHQAVGKALVGEYPDATGPKPFKRVNTAVYSVTMGDDAGVESALQDFVTVLGTHRSIIDYVSLTLTRHRATNALDDLADEEE